MHTTDNQDEDETLKHTRRKGPNWERLLCWLWLDKTQQDVLAGNKGKNGSVYTGISGLIALR